MVSVLQGELEENWEKFTEVCGALSPSLPAESYSLPRVPCHLQSLLNHYKDGQPVALERHKGLPSVSVWPVGG